MAMDVGINYLTGMADDQFSMTGSNIMEQSGLKSHLPGRPPPWCAAVSSDRYGRPNFVLGRAEELAAIGEEFLK